MCYSAMRLGRSERLGHVPSGDGYTERVFLLTLSYHNFHRESRVFCAAITTNAQSRRSARKLPRATNARQRSVAREGGNTSLLPRD